jgi:hypothetical protein
LEVGEFTNLSLIAHARRIGATHIVRGLREATNFNEEFHFHGVAERIDPSILMVHFICAAQLLHVSSSTARELEAMGEQRRGGIRGSSKERLRVMSVRSCSSECAVFQLPLSTERSRRPAARTIQKSAFRQHRDLQLAARGRRIPQIRLCSVPLRRST